ncbi:recombinase family protein [Gluconobacter cerinus]|uniref:recombinase family protein n=1 Tax=Gluconobacter cerinus TaxID=38307 RepID=UPI001B8D5831|nr:recombinase family protein [Gluconobacter cerinus]MBS1021265.1 recombinase family protein [Gluconobacter cerinus]
MTTYGYARVSTDGQTTDPQVLELRNAGVDLENCFVETVSGSVSAARRPVLQKLLEHLCNGDTLTVVKLDRLGRDTIDTLTLIEDLKAKGVGVRILALGADTGGAAGNLIIGVLASVAAWERDIIRERTISGLHAARASGKLLGRRHAMSPAGRQEAVRAINGGEAVRSVARRYGVAPRTIYRLLEAITERMETGKAA